MTEMPLLKEKIDGYANYAENRKLLEKWSNKPCVVATYEDRMGKIVLFKGNKFFMFYQNYFALSYHIARIYQHMDMYMKCVNLIDGHGTVYNEELFMNFKTRLMAEQL